MSDIRRYSIKELEALGEVECRVVQEDTGKEETIKINFRLIMPRLRNVMKHLRSGATAPFGGFISEIIWTIDPRVQTACTDGVRVYFNPMFADLLITKAGEQSATYKETWLKNHPGLRYTKQMELRYIYRLVLFVLIHEIYHMVYRHCKQSEARPETRGGRDHYNVNYAMDAEINRDIESHMPEFKGCTELANGVREGIERFPAEIWSKIYTTLKEEGHDAQPPQMNPLSGQGQQSNNQQLSGLGGQLSQLNLSGRQQNQQQQSPAQKAQQAAQRAKDAALRALQCALNGDEQGAKQATQEAADAAREAALQAQNAAQNAQLNAQDSANRAQQAANEAQDSANNGDEMGARQSAKDAADATRDSANLAQETALNSQDAQASKDASDAALKANDAADNAEQTANDANSSALDVADAAQLSADAAKQASQQASDNAQNAQDSADNANQAADDAEQKANDNNASGQDAALAAQLAADAALQAAESAQQQGLNGQPQGSDDGDGGLSQQQGGDSGSQGLNGGQSGSSQSGQGGQQGLNQPGGNSGNQSGSGSDSGQGGDSGQDSADNSQNGGTSQGTGGDGTQSGNQSSQDGSDDGSESTDGQGQSGGDPTKHVQITISTSDAMQNGDMISVDDGLDICDKEQVELSASEKNMSPMDHAESKLTAAKQGLKGVGKGALARKLKEIDDSLLVPVIDDWKDRMREHLVNAGGDNEKKVIKKRRFGTERYDRYTPAKYVDAPGDDAADVFYLVDASGSISDDILQRVFSEIIAMEREGDMHITKSCLTYFSTYIDEERIREWYYDTDETEVQEKILREEGKDAGGGTDIPGCINAVIELDDYYRVDDPHTVLIVFTDGEDNLGTINDLDFDNKNQTIFAIMNSKGRCEAIQQELLTYDIPELNIITIDTNEV